MGTLFQAFIFLVTALLYTLTQDAPIDVPSFACGFTCAFALASVTRYYYRNKHRI